MPRVDTLNGSSEFQEYGQTLFPLRWDVARYSLCPPSLCCWLQKFSEHSGGSLCCLVQAVMTKGWAGSCRLRAAVPHCCSHTNMSHMLSKLHFELLSILLRTTPSLSAPKLPYLFPISFNPQLEYTNGYFTVSDFCATFIFVLSHLFLIFSPLLLVSQ